MSSAPCTPPAGGLQRDESVPTLAKMAIPAAEQSPPLAKLSLPSLAASEQRIGAKPIRPPPERQTSDGRQRPPERQTSDGRQRQGTFGRQRQGTESRQRQGTLRGSLSAMPEGSVLTELAEDDRTRSVLRGEPSERMREASMDAYLNSLDGSRMSQAPKVVRSSWRWRRSSRAQDVPSSSIRGSLSAMLGFGRNSRASVSHSPHRQRSDDTASDDSGMDAYLGSLDDRLSHAPVQVRSSWRWRGAKSSVSRQSYATDYGYSGRESPEMMHADRSFARGVTSHAGEGLPRGSVRTNEATK